MEKTVLITPDYLKPVGPYSQGIVFDRLIFLAGQIPISPETGKLIEGDVAIQTQQVLENIQVLLKNANSSFKKVLKTTVFLTDLAHFPIVNQIYSNYFTDTPPARSTIQVAALPLKAQVEIEVVAFRNI